MSTNSVLRLRALFIVTALAIAVAGCQSGHSTTSPAPDKANLVVATVPAASSAGLYIAQQEGFFRQAGLHVKIVVAGSDAQASAELLSGRLDVLNGTYVGFIAAQSHGVGQFHVVADGYAGAPKVDQIVVPSGSPIKQPKDLIGKTIAVNALGSVASLQVESALADNMIKPGQVRLTAIPFPGMLAALQRHLVGAAYLPEPFLSQAEKAIGAQGLLDVDQGGAQSFPISGYVVTQRWFQRYPRAAAAFARAIEQGQAVAATDRAAVEQVLTTFANTPRQTAAVMALGQFPTTVDSARLQRVADLMLRFQLLQGRFDVTAMTQAP